MPHAANTLASDQSHRAEIKASTADLADAFDFVAEANPAYALALVGRIEAAGNRLGAHATGRPGRIAHTYEKSLPELATWAEAARAALGEEGK